MIILIPEHQFNTTIHGNSYTFYNFYRIKPNPKTLKNLQQIDQSLQNYTLKIIEG